MLIEYRPLTEISGAARRFIAGFDAAGAEAIFAGLAGSGMSSWAAVIDGEVRAVAGARLRHVTSGDPDYTYMPPAYALIAMSGWFVAPEDWPLMGGIFRQIVDDAARAGIDRLSIEIPLEHTGGIAFVLAEGFVPDVILAARPSRAGDLTWPPGVRIRRARRSDAEDLLALTLEEANYHAEHTASGIVGNQDPEPSREFVTRWLSDQETKGLPTFVAEMDGALVGMLPLTLIDDGGGGPVPADYGYIASTCVTAKARGQGIGTALVEHGLDAAHALGLRVVLVHYIADNTLSSPLWEGRGFEPITVTFTKVGLNG